VAAYLENLSISWNIAPPRWRPISYLDSLHNFPRTIRFLTIRFWQSCSKIRIPLTSQIEELTKGLNLLGVLEFLRLQCTNPHEDTDVSAVIRAARLRNTDEAGKIPRVTVLLGHKCMYGDDDIRTPANIQEPQRCEDLLLMLREEAGWDSEIHTIVRMAES
jgi:hypothetical protein